MTLGAGVAAFGLALLGSWGPCGPANPIGFIAMMVGLVAIPLGCLMLLAAALRRLRRRLN